MKEEQMHNCVVKMREKVDMEQSVDLTFIRCLVSSAVSQHSALGGGCQSSRFVDRNHLFGEVFR